jgi:hypothetical protein
MFNNFLFTFLNPQFDNIGKNHLRLIFSTFIKNIHCLFLYFLSLIINIFELNIKLSHTIQLHMAI